MASVCVCMCQCDQRAVANGPLGHRGQRSSTPSEEVRKCLARGSDKDSHPSFLSLRISTPYNILPRRTDPALHSMEMGEQNDPWWHNTPPTASLQRHPQKHRQEAGSENRKWNTYGVACCPSDKSRVTSKNRKREGRAGQDELVAQTSGVG